MDLFEALKYSRDHDVPIRLKTWPKNKVVKVKREIADPNHYPDSYVLEDKDGKSISPSYVHDLVGRALKDLEGDEQWEVYKNPSIYLNDVACIEAVVIPDRGIRIQGAFKDSFFLKADHAMELASFIFNELGSLHNQ